MDGDKLFNDARTVNARFVQFEEVQFFIILTTRVIYIREKKLVFFLSFRPGSKSFLNRGHL